VWGAGLAVLGWAVRTAGGTAAAAAAAFRVLPSAAEDAAARAAFDPFSLRLWDRHVA
jgi:hypothetical protein